jgi:hypothetical protein
MEGPAAFETGHKDQDFYIEKRFARLGRAA